MDVTLRPDSATLQTKILDSVEAAAEILRCGGLVAFPTETVFGLGADARSQAAIKRLFAAKGRPSDNPLIVHLADFDQWPLAARTMTELGRRVLDLYAPGPVTVILPKAQAICQSVTAGLDTVGIRFPASDIARRLLRAAAIPIAAPSANLSGRPSGTTWASVLEDLDGRIDAILKADSAQVGLESSVVDCTGSVPILLRPGAVGLEELRKHFPTAIAFDGVSSSTSAASPGIRHPHYQPRAKVRLVTTVAGWCPVEAELDLKFAYAGLDAPPASTIYSERFADLAAYARGFYEFLRAADRRGADVVLLQVVAATTAEQAGLATALFDRQCRAAGKTEIPLA